MEQINIIITNGWLLITVITIVILVLGLALQIIHTDKLKDDIKLKDEQYDRRHEILNNTDKKMQRLTIKNDELEQIFSNDQCIIRDRDLKIDSLFTEIKHKEITIKQKDETIKFLSERQIILEQLAGNVEHKYAEQSEILKNEAVRIAYNNFLEVLQTSKEVSNG